MREEEQTSGATKLSDCVNKSFVKVSSPPETRFGIGCQDEARVCSVIVVPVTLHIFLTHNSFVRRRLHQSWKHLVRL